MARRLQPAFFPLSHLQTAKMDGDASRLKYIMELIHLDKLKQVVFLVELKIYVSRGKDQGPLSPRQMDPQ